MPLILHFFSLSLRAILVGQLPVSFPHVALATCPGSSPLRFMPAFRPVISPGRAQGPMAPRRAWTPLGLPGPSSKRGLLRRAAPTSQKCRPRLLRRAAFCEKYSFLYTFAFRTAASQKSGFFLKFGQILVQISLASGPGGPWKLLPHPPLRNALGPQDDERTWALIAAAWSLRAPAPS